MSVELLDAHRCDLGEGPAWDARSGEVLWVDITGRTIHALGLENGVRREARLPVPVGAVVPRAGDGYLVALESGLALLDGDDVTPIAPFPDGNGLRANDAKCDPHGRCFVGTMAYDFEPGRSSLYRFSAGAVSLEPVLEGLTIANGLGWSPDGRTLYFIDSPTRRIDAFDYDLDTGTIANRRVLVHVPEEHGMPDGMTVDADGCLWVGLWGGGAVHRYTPDGRLDRTVALPCSQVTSCAFAGDRLDRLVITTAAYELETPEELAGATFVADPAGVAGLPVAAYGG